MWGTTRLSFGSSVVYFYVRSLALLLDAHGIVYHFYADDTQFYIKTGFKLCLPTCKTLKFGEPKYLVELLSPPELDLGVNL